MLLLLVAALPGFRVRPTQTTIQWSSLSPIELANKFDYFELEQPEWLPKTGHFYLVEYRDAPLISIESHEFPFFLRVINNFAGYLCVFMISIHMDSIFLNRRS